MAEIEYNSPVIEVNRGRKTRKKGEGNILCPSSTRYTDRDTGDPYMSCNHGLGVTSNPRVTCKAALLTYHDLLRFKRKLYANVGKINQDLFLYKYMQIKSVSRKTVPVQKRCMDRLWTVTYNIPNIDGNLVPVCKKTFLTVTGVNSLRLWRLVKSCGLSGQPPSEKRGGRRTVLKDAEKTDIVKENILKYRCRESHYSRSKCQRSYLPPDLNLKKMWQLFDAERKSKNVESVSLSKYKSVFYKYFNLGFGNPHEDTCSACKEMLLKIKKERDLDAKNELRTQYRLHNMRAKAFFRVMNETEPNTIKVCFDCQQNQPLPKLSVGEVFYSRQAWLYNLCIMQHRDDKKQLKEDICFYTWLETQAARGANEVSSALLHYVQELDKCLFEKGEQNLTLKLFSDSCSSQNKNSIVLGVLSYFLLKSKAFIRVIHYFPIRGHSYMPPDRVFGRIEKDFRKQEFILSPNDYSKILMKHGVEKRWGDDWNSYDFKSTTKKMLKTRLPFKMTHARILQYEKKRNKVKHYFSETYSGSPINVEIFKPGIKSMELLVEKSQKKLKMNMVSLKKKEDIKKLLAFCDLDDDAQNFYDEMLAANSVPGNENEDIRREFDEFEPLL